MKKHERFDIFLSRLATAAPANSRDAALALMSRIMDEVEEEFSDADRSSFGERMRVWGWDFGWKNLQTDPCFWDDSAGSTHRTHIYHSGRIVITRIKGGPADVIDKPGSI